jgi:hypothetical protein
VSRTALQKSGSPDSPILANMIRAVIMLSFTSHFTFDDRQGRRSSRNHSRQLDNHSRKFCKGGSSQTAEQHAPSRSPLGRPETSRSLLAQT